MIIDLHELLQEDNGNRSYHLQLEADVFETSTASYKIKDYDLQLSFIMKERNIYPPDVKDLLFWRYLATDV
jgi:hypothetical protein